MSRKTIKIVYWLLAFFFFIAMLADGYGGVTRQQAGKDVLIHLGYPMYLLPLLGIAKILGAFGFFQTINHTLKEWAFAGFVITFIGAIASRIYLGDSVLELLPAIIMLAYLLATYYFWVRLQNDTQKPYR